MHILLLTDNFMPEVNAPASRSFEHCREWAKSGHQVTVITGVPNFPRGEVFPGYRNHLWQTEIIDGIRVIRVWTFICANQGFLFRTLDFFSFMITAFLASFFVRKIHVVVGTSPQFFTVCAAWMVSALRRVPFVFELRDLWPHSIQVVGAMKNKFVLRALSRVELFLYHRAALIVAVTHSFKRILTARGVDPAKIAVVTNGVDLHRFEPAQKDPQFEARLGLATCFVAGYIGTHGRAHGLDTVLDAARLLQKRGENDVRILMLGDGEEKAALQRRAQAEGLHNILFLDTVPKDQVSRYWSLLDCSLIHLRRDPLFRSVIPSKLFEAMATGIPVVLGVEGEAADIVTRYKVGVTVPPEAPQILTDAILRLRDDPAWRMTMAENGAGAARRFSRPVLALSMLQAMEGIVQNDCLSETEMN
ncbi:glycosyltransferase family 4 protein [Tianweitania sp. BSSL-BM11]|uniref:Glycosyltransferase family 4 protein n=1 Tax=Tianweitania aestuarii TaxID=2814886 RepID=A0ABS5RQX9_9HYPH|nr:glycosyltransferase family 4 protein [Tianweitania aestuarii]MBS9719451.1 glycosyltransferase family 4 protein [Tianweitania aestuarii]